MAFFPYGINVKIAASNLRKLLATVAGELMSVPMHKLCLLESGLKLHKNMFFWKMTYSTNQKKLTT